MHYRLTESLAANQIISPLIIEDDGRVTGCMAWACTPNLNLSVSSSALPPVRYSKFRNGLQEGPDGTVHGPSLLCFRTKTSGLSESDPSDKGDYSGDLRDIRDTNQCASGECDFCQRRKKER